MSRIRAERLSFAYTDAAPILSSVTLDLGPGFTAVVGENGAGKTTLLRLITGDLTPSEGRVRLEPAGGRVVLCPQTVEVASPAVIAFAARDDGAARRLTGILSLAPGLELWETLSPGERKRWQLAAALGDDPDVLLLDEPTNHVDAAGRALLLAALESFRGVGLVVSHDRAFLEALTARTLRLHRGAARLWDGSYSSARARWEAEVAEAWEARAAAQAERRRVERRLDEARREHGGAESARSLGRRQKDRHDHDARTLSARTRVAWAEDRLGRKVSLLRRDAERAAAAVPEAPPEKGLGRSVFVGFERPPRPWLLELDAPELAAGDTALVRELRVRLGREDRVRLEGPNGAGKTTLLTALLAASSLPRERVLHLPQELAPGAGSALLDELRRSPPDVRGRALSLVAALGSDPDRLLASGAPSPGEARKLHLALGLGRHAWALVLDEPTNHFDVPTVERLEAALVAYPGAILLVTHDERFAARCTATTWRICGRRLDVA